MPILLFSAYHIISDSMATDKNSFIAYRDWESIFGVLPDKKAGQLAKHLFAYVNDKNPETDDLVINASFALIKTALKRDLVKYKEYIDKQIDNGKKGGRPKQAKEPNPLQDNPTPQKKADSVSVSVSVSVSEEKEEIYNTYPSKCPINNSSTGKGAKNKDKISGLLKDYTKEDLISRIDWYVKDCKKHNRFIKNFSTFLNNLPDMPYKEEQEKSNKTKFKLKVNAGMTREYFAKDLTEAKKMYYNDFGAFPEDIYEVK